jgi:hypothetical protein
LRREIPSKLVRRRRTSHAGLFDSVVYDFDAMPLERGNRMYDLSELVTIAQQAVGLGYDLVRNTTPTEIRRKGDRDVVTEVDLAVAVSVDRGDLLVGRGAAQVVVPPPRRLRTPWWTQPRQSVMHLPQGPAGLHLLPG